MGVAVPMRQVAEPRQASSVKQDPTSRDHLVFPQKSRKNDFRRYNNTGNKVPVNGIEDLY